MLSGTHQQTLWLLHLSTIANILQEKELG